MRRYRARALLMRCVEYKSGASLNFRSGAATANQPLMHLKLAVHFCPAITKYYLYSLITGVVKVSAVDLRKWITRWRWSCGIAYSRCIKSPATYVNSKYICRRYNVFFKYIRVIQPRADAILKKAFDCSISFSRHSRSPVNERPRYIFTPLEPWGTRTV